MDTLKEMVCPKSGYHGLRPLILFGAIPFGSHVLPACVLIPYDWVEPPRPRGYSGESHVTEHAPHVLWRKIEQVVPSHIAVLLFQEPNAETIPTRNG